MSVVIVILGILINVILFYGIEMRRQKHLEIRIANSIMGFTICYMGISLALVFIKHFTVIRALILTTLVSAVLFALMWFFTRKKTVPTIKAKLGTIDYIGLMIILIGVVATVSKAGITTTSYHQSYYQYHAMSLANYGVDDELALSCGNIDYFYGSPAFPSVLALAASIVSYRYMLMVNVVWTIIYGIYTSAVCEELGIRKINKYFVLMMAMLAPTMISAAKTSHYYLLLSVLVLLAVNEMLIIAKEKSTIIPLVLVTLGIMAVTVKTVFFVPMFVALAYIIYAHNPKLEYKILACILTFAQGIFIVAFYKIDPSYVYRDWWSWLNHSTPEDPYGFNMLCIIAIAYFAITLVMLLPGGGKTIKSIFADNGFLKAVGGIGVGAILIACLKIAFREICGERKAMLTESLLALCISTGLFIIPLAVLFLVKRKVTKPVSVGLSIIATIFVYGLFIVCMSEVPYIGTSVVVALMPALPFIVYGIMLGTMFISGEKDVDKTQKKKLLAMAGAIIVMLPFSLYSVMYRPETAIDNKDLAKIDEFIEEGNNAIYVAPSAESLQFALKLTTKTKVYIAGDVIPEEFDNVYVLAYEQDELNEILMEFNAKDAQIRHNGSLCDLLAIYTAIGVRPVDSSRTLYLGK